MRKKHKRLLLGMAFGIIITSLFLGTAFYFFAYKKYTSEIANYKNLLESYRNPELIKAYRFLKDKKAMSKLSKEDVEIIELPKKFASKALSPVDGQIFQKHLNGDVKAGTIVYQAMLYQNQDLASDLRVFELAGLLVQQQLNLGDAVDIRINFPSGLDYVVLSKKRLIDRLSIGENESELCIFHLNEDEILRLSSALVDAYLHQGTYLYTTKYISGNNQKAAAITYPVNAAVQTLITEDENIVSRAIVHLESQKREALSASLNRLAANNKAETIEFAETAEEVEPSNTNLISEVE